MTKAAEPTDRMSATHGSHILRRTIADVLRTGRSAPLFATTLALGVLGGASAANGAEPASTQLLLAREDFARTDTVVGVENFELDLPSQDLNVALQAVAHASHHRLLYRAELVRGKSSAALKGRFTASQALERVLSGTDLTFEITSSGVVLIRGSGTDESGQASPQDGRLPSAARTDLAHRGDQQPLWRAQSSDEAGAANGGGQGSGGSTSESPQHETELNEVIVTAQHRKESVKDVPISMSVFSSEELDALRAQRFEDYITHVPNVTYISGGHFGPDVALRGISVATGGRYDPIGVTVDGAGFGATNSGTILNTQYLDVERIEILRGPQGTLTGRNAEGGSINIITAQPSTEEFLFKGILDYGRFDTGLAKAVVNVPIGDTFAVRAAAYVQSSDGAVNNVGPGGGNSGYDNVGGRIATRWKPTEDFTLDVSFAYEELIWGLENALTRDIFTDEARREQKIAELESWGGQYDSVSFFGDVGANGGHVRNDVVPDSYVKDWIGALHGSYEVANYTVEFFYSHFSYRPQYRFEWDQTEYNFLQLTQREDVAADSAEFRVTSKSEGPFNWVAGVSWLEEKNDFDTQILTGIGQDGVNPVTDTNLPVVGGAYSPNPVFHGIVLSQLESIGVFANVFWDISDRLHLSAGGRYSSEKNLYGAADTVTSSVSDDLEGEVDDFSPRIALNLDLNDDTTTYVQFATGYRSGFANNQKAVDLGLAPSRMVDSEHVKNYEVGIQGSLLDDKLSFAAALFYMDFTDMQVSDFAEDDEGNYAYFNTNAASAYARGFELETVVRPFESVELRANVGYVDSAIDEFNYYGEALEDVAFPNVRPWTIAVTGLYTRPLTHSLKGQLRVDYTTGSHTFGGFRSTPFWDVPAYKNFDVSLGVSSERWSVIAYMANITDEKYWTGTVGGSSSSNRGGLGVFIPRRYGVRFTYDFSGN